MYKIRDLSQQKISLFIALYLGILLNLPIFYRRYHELHYDNTLSLMVEMVAAFALVYFLTKLVSFTGKTVYRVLLSIVVVASVAAAYYMIIFNVDIGYGILASALAVDSLDLSKESVGSHFFIWLIAVSFIPLILLWGSKMPGSSLKETRFRTVAIKIVLLVVSGLACWVPLKLMGGAQEAHDRINNRMMASYGGVVAGSYLPSNWLSGLGLYIYSSYSQAEDTKNLFDPSKHFTYVPPKDVKDLYVVFVIGESARRDHMGIYGYARDNTPNLEKEKNLVALQGYSCDTSTKLSLRCMFVRMGGTRDNPERTLKEMNVFSVLKNQGFSSDLYSMQSEAWFYNKTKADEYSLRESIGSEKRNAGKPVDDMLLINEMKDSIANHPQGKHLIILHTKGSHYLYSERYPRNFARYQPECMGIDDACSTEEMINAYDNSLLYTDDFLEQVFNQMRDKNAIVFYASDHGESISQNMHFHGTPRDHAPIEQRTVPIMVWASDKFLANDQNRQAFQQLQIMARNKAPAYHEKLFDSILGCIGYTSPNGGIVEQHNWCHVPTTGK
ncbi:kdo(2)-lipid A phosphoethanolamine 7''-transferase [Rouxiella badensis]|jgi:KDO II ethanolaminephosphotransferase|uniref:kdo(2)-lipid A phosphoethanolamine 7''-transferase n=1 Tax=Rouxiella badensis TaxID=1646377 RepID=UPI00036A3A8A|nr:kdo(2)-lipid A phosphoethanolamine 7''-transferase [Rouxiella badensis]MCC3717487.1 kdo(2)-lipid A phosphoethanolamine 7''-transferase [Rouxiella badensis]MCC3727569.1 kdo(2)-lipid A phosphoethanolamine 7''-transferase [Rouxiella badensis]MCC3732487.1 kdo(2)-lipid A phosphoethanolamine 7''-transferase [Rouxiella badensis]MCC3740401.1 kdo(2)-lipid A phosphoethanolamine 7''-transferase [Rouxiella badensis]MCC3745751.1 kdo(2)-lipid A phosphoethanolamine 7''-transferase [Rouxiella badensis]